MHDAFFLLKNLNLKIPLHGISRDEFFTGELLALLRLTILSQTFTLFRCLPNLRFFRGTLGFLAGFTLGTRFPTARSVLAGCLTFGRHG